MISVTHPVIDAPPLPTIPTGKPLFIFRLPGLPSVNDVLYLAPRARAGAIKAERDAGYASLIDWANKRRLPLVYRKIGRRNVLQVRDTVITSPVFVFAAVKYRVSKANADKADRIRDIYNLLVKGFIDGCTDANLWHDDSAEYHRDFWVHYAGLAPRPEVEIRVYENQ